MLLAGMRKWLTAPRWYLFDLVVAFALFLTSVKDERHDNLAWWIFTIPMVVSVLVRRRWPVPAVILAGVGALAHHLDNVSSLDPIDLALPLSVYTLASSGVARRRAVLLLGAALASVSILSAIQLMTDSPAATQQSIEQANAKASAAAQLEPERLATKPGTTAKKATPVPDTTELIVSSVSRALTVLLALGLAFAIGDGVRSRRAHLRTLETRAADLEREQQQRIALARAAERARITRELHDVVAHGLSVMVVQAQGGAAALHRHPDRSQQALQNVITTGRNSLAEMRRLLDVARADPAEDPQRAPQPGLATIPELVDRVRATGTHVAFTIEGEPVPLPATVDLAAYRIVQEALTNTIKHAGTGATARITLRFDPHQVEIDVSDDGIGAPIPPDGNGSGLRGIAERVNVLGGTLVVGPVEPNGFRVHAVLPLPEAES